MENFSCIRPLKKLSLPPCNGSVACHPIVIDGCSCLAVIAARGGSKGLPGKNLLKLGNQSLLAWAVAAAKDSTYLDRSIVSTDDLAIANAARAAGAEVPFMRPPELAKDDSPVAETLVHALEAQETAFDYIVLLAATSPLRTAVDIDVCIEACHRGAPAAVSVSEVAKPPEWACRLDTRERLRPVIPGKGLLTRRQDITPAFIPNGAVYVARTDWFLEHRGFYGDDTIGCIMPAERSVDIDSMQDLIIARWLFETQKDPKIEVH